MLNNNIGAQSEVGSGHSPMREITPRNFTTSNVFDIQGLKKLDRKLTKTLKK